MDRTSQSNVRLKAELLSKGLQIDEAALRSFGPPYIEKRRAYGNPDSLDILNLTIPQELYLLPDRLIVSVKVVSSSPFVLTYGDGEFRLLDRDGRAVPVTFPMRPVFYDQSLDDGTPVKSLLTLYGGNTLGAFLYGNCSLVDGGEACHYCSIGPNRARESEFPLVISRAELMESLRLALDDAACPIQTVMLNGGNFKDPNRSFDHYLSMAKAAEEVIGSSGREVELHLIVYPPADLERLAALRSTSIGIAMNTEIFDPELFERYCPGKANGLGQAHLLEALERAASLLGERRVFSILVGGLEPIDSLSRGIQYLSERGITPVINVFHADPQTPLAHHPVPSADAIMRMGAELQAAYEQFAFEPFYRDCGRNSLDTEAALGLF